MRRILNGAARGRGAFFLRGVIDMSHFRAFSACPGGANVSSLGGASGMGPLAGAMGDGRMEERMDERQAHRRALAKIEALRRQHGIIIGVDGLGVSPAVRERHAAAVDRVWLEYAEAIGHHRFAAKLRASLAARAAGQAS